MDSQAFVSKTRVPAPRPPSMQLREALREGLEHLVRAHVPSPELAAELLLMHALGCDRGFLYAHPETEIAPDALERYFATIAERATGKPTQYITGHQEFWGLDFEVTPDVLIPRPETEHVVEAVIELADVAPGFSPANAALKGGSTNKQRQSRKNAALRIVDVGTGSGCIALALAHEFPNAKIFATEISRPALEVARRNAARLKMSGQVEFVEGDLLEPFLKPAVFGSSSESGAVAAVYDRRNKNRADDSAATAGEIRFDFVVSNPPYVGRDELDQVQREVRDFEPRIAIGGLEQGDEIYRRLFPQAWQVLKPGGFVVVEIGYNMRDRVLALLGAVAPASSPAKFFGSRDSAATTAEGWAEIEVLPDLAGIPRVVSAKKGAGC